MKLYLISYTPGYSADFLASLIHQDKKFYPLDSVERSSDNRFMFPNFVKTFDSKMTDNISNFLLEQDFEYLKSTYGKNLCINAHMYANIQGPYERKVKIFASSERSRRIAYAMWWYKSHIHNEPPPPERINFIMNNDVPEHFRTNYLKWKYLAWHKLKDTEISLEEYIRKIYKFNSDAGQTKAEFVKFENIDLDKCMYTDNIDVSMINEIFDINIDKRAIETYRDKNYKIIKSIGLDLDSDHYFDQLSAYVHKQLKDSEINLYSLQNS